MLKDVRVNFRPPLLPILLLSLKAFIAEMGEVSLFDCVSGVHPSPLAYAATRSLEAMAAWDPASYQDPSPSQQSAVGEAVVGIPEGKRDLSSGYFHGYSASRTHSSVFTSSLSSVMTLPRVSACCWNSQWAHAIGGI